MLASSRSGNLTARGGVTVIGTQPKPSRTTNVINPRRVRVAALLLITCLLLGPVGTHGYWALGGTWGLHQPTSTGIRVVAVVVIVLLVAAVLVVLARVGLWRQAFVSDRVIRFFAWALAGVFLVETLAAFTWSRGDSEWWLYGPVSFVIALLAAIVASALPLSRD
jgi:hypothetical protein